MRRAAKVDENQPQIVSALRAVGAQVEHLHSVGNGCPDIVVGFRQQNYLLEIKNPAHPPSKRKLNPDQVRWHTDWSGHVEVVETVGDALKAIGAIA